MVSQDWFHVERKLTTPAVKKFQAKLFGLLIDHRFLKIDNNDGLSTLVDVSNCFVQPKCGRIYTDNNSKGAENSTTN